MLFIDSWIMGMCLLLLALNFLQYWLSWKERQKFTNELSHIIVSLSEKSQEYIAIKSQDKADERMDKAFERKGKVRPVKQKKIKQDLIL